MTHRRGGLTAALRAGTSRLHREAERSGVIAELLAGRAGLADYLALLGNLLPVYETMEAPDAPHQVRCLVPSALFRAGAIRTDLAARCTAPVALSPEGAAYAASVAASGKRMVAHAYARYLGDLSGGRVLARLVPGLAFHSFPQSLDLAAAKAAFRAEIDRIGEDMQDWSALVEEARAAFRHNIAISRAVSAAGGETARSMSPGRR